jgi:MFS family permease
MIVAALGYFVDVYDLVLFSVVRLASLKDLGLTAEESFHEGVFLLNSQMAGMLLGGVIFGVLGDRKGRLSVLFASILLYSLANIANGFVTNTTQYAFLRFIAGIGLAGELGIGITLVAESLPINLRGLGTTLIATIGVLGAVAAAATASYLPWRFSYIIGGVMGLLLLVLRVRVHESPLFTAYQNLPVTSKNSSILKLLFTKKARGRFIGSILCGVPIWFATGVLVTFAPELATERQIAGLVLPALCVNNAYIGLVFGDLGSGLLSQKLKSRKESIAIFLLLNIIFALIFITVPKSSSSLHLLCLPLGFSVGYWAVLITSSCEQFGTNLRATVTTTVPNFIRASTIPLIMIVEFFRGKGFSMEDSVLMVGAMASCVAFLGLTWMRETFTASLDFHE